MKTVNLALILVALLSSLASAQFAEPASEMASFKPLLGNWHGEGTFIPVPGAPKMPWTAKASVTTILDGHFVQEDFAIDIGEAAPGNLTMRGIHGWDALKERYSSVNISNQDAPMSQSLLFNEAGQMVVYSSATVDGVHVADQNVLTFDDKGYSFVVNRSWNGSPFAVHVEGRMLRGGDGVTAQDMAGALAPPAPEMKKQDVFLGSWSFEGGYSLMPGMELMPISGHQVIETAMGGHVQRTLIKGDAPPGTDQGYESHNYTAWEASKGHYLVYQFDNMGLSSIERCHPAGPKSWVYTMATDMDGESMLMRSTSTLMDGGKAMKITGHRLLGANAPEVYFRMEAKRSDK